MVFDPIAVSYAFIESYLNRRVNKEWAGQVNLAEITPSNLSDKVKNPEIVQKIESCIHSIRALETLRYETVEKKLELVEELNVEENQQLNLAKEKGQKLLGLYQLFTKKDPMVAQLQRAIRSLFVEHLTKLLDIQIKLKASISDPKELEAKNNEIENLQKKLLMLDPKQNSYMEFYNRWIKTDAIAAELKEDTWDKFQDNLRLGARRTFICNRIAALYAVAKPAVKSETVNNRNIQPPQSPQPQEVPIPFSSTYQITKQMPPPEPQAITNPAYVAPPNSPISLPVAKAATKPLAKQTPLRRSTRTHHKKSYLESSDDEVTLKPR